MKKIIGAFCLLFIFTSTLYAEIDLGQNQVKCSLEWNAKKCLQRAYTKEIIVSKSHVEKNMPQGGLYIKALNSYFKKYEGDRKKLETLLSKIEKAKNNISDKNSETTSLINYIEFSLLLALLNIPEEVIQIKNSEDIFKLSEEELMIFIENSSYQDLEKLALNFYKNEEELYKDMSNLYNTQIQKARDTIRINHLKVIQAAVEQSYQDIGEYPSQENLKELTTPYLIEIPSDPKAGITLNNCNFGYKYEVGKDKNGIFNGNYKLSTCFENTESISKRANNEFDEGSNDNKWEIGYWNTQTIFTESFYINGISKWEAGDPTDLELNSNTLSSEEKKRLFQFTILMQYYERNITETQ